MHTSSSLQRAAGKCLADLDGMAAAYVRDVRNLPGYIPSVVSDEELRSTALKSLDLLLRLLMGADVRGSLMEVSSEIGKRRARQGLALDSLLRAVRMDFRFLWQALQSRLEETDVDSFGAHVLGIWDAVEFHTSHVQAAYLDELTHMRRDLELERSYLLRRLLVGGINEPQQLEHISAALGLALDGRFVLAVGNASFSREFRSGVTHLDPRVPIHTVDGAEVAIIEESLAAGSAMERLRSLPAGIAPPVAGLAGLSTVWGLAQRLADCVTSPDTGAELAGSWERILGQDLESGLDAFRHASLAGLQILTPAAQRLVLETVREFFHTGSIAMTAETMFCHRNTVLKRLRHFTECTGFDPSRPDDAGTIRLLLGRKWGELDARSRASRNVVP